MKSRLLVALVGVLGAFAFGQAQEPGQNNKGKNDKAGQIREDLTLRQQILARQFAEFEQALLKLKQRLERSPKQADREQAVILGKALDKCKDFSVDTQFEQFVDFLKKENLKSVGNIKVAVERSAKLTESLREILALLREDTRAAKLREERLRLEELLKRLEKVIHKQKVAESITLRGKTEKTELERIQNNVTKETADLAKKMGGKGEAKDLKGQSKDGKGGGKKGESKDAGKGTKTGAGKDAGKKSAGKPGEAKGDKSGKGGEPKQGGAKSGKGGEAKQGGAKGAKGGDGKQGGAKDNKGGQGKEAGAKDAGKEDPGAKIKTKQGEAKGDKSEQSGNKSGQKQGEAKSGQKGSQNKQGGAKGSKSGDSKSGSKSGSQSKQGEAKSGSQSSGQGQAKSSGQQAGKQKGDNNKPPPQPPQPPPAANGKKQVEDANYKQNQAEEKIANDNNKGANDDQNKAIKDLEAAKKKLEDLLNQIREEELERLLAALQARCEKMLAMQMQVLTGTEQVFTAISSHKDKKASRLDQQQSLRLSDDEKEIVVEATKAIEMLEAEGSAVAFPEVFKQVREDMKNVQRRLGIVDAGTVTQAIEKDIIDTLKEMIEALKKARQELDNKKNPPPGSPPPPQDQKLLDQIAELKMIRSMQLRVNTRTKVYGNQYQGEQAAEPRIVGELRQLSERQDRIFEVTNRIAKGDNK